MKLYVDFDGVINSFTTPFTTPYALPDPPIDGAINWLIGLLDSGHSVVIYTARMLNGDSQAVIIDWLMKWGMPIGKIEKLSFSCVKVGADVYIDDRAFRFEGHFPSLEHLKLLAPWSKD